MVSTYTTPGVYKEEVFPTPSMPFLTGVPAFLGRVSQVPQDSQGNPQFNTPQPLRLWSQFEQLFGAPPPDGYLADTVRGFFLNGGRLCYVTPLRQDLLAEESLKLGLKALEAINTIDLVCAPDVMRTPEQATRLQQLVLDHCDEHTGDRFAILDSLDQATTEQVLDQRKQLHAKNGAIYHPWIQELTSQRLVPPCGYVAGVYARTDQQTGVYKAPANEALKGVLDLSVHLNNNQQGPLNKQGINCLRVFPGRGIRVWGARTLSRDPAWTYVSARRLFITAGRWIEHNLTGIVFEPNDPNLWARIQRELTVYFNTLFRQGALKGRSAQEAFYVKCNAETNSPEVRKAGKVVTEIGLAPAIPSEFIVVRIIHGAGGITIAGPVQPG